MMLFKILIIKEIQLTSQFVAYLIFALAGIWVEVLFCLLALVVLGLGFDFGESYWLQLLDTLQLIGGQSLTFGLIALHCNKLLGINLLAFR